MTTLPPSLYRCIYELQRRDGSLHATGQLTVCDVPVEGGTLVVGGALARVEAVVATHPGELRVRLRVL